MARRKRKQSPIKKGSRSLKMPETGSMMGEEMEDMGEDEPVYHDIDKDRTEESPIDEEKEKSY